MQMCWSSVSSDPLGNPVLHLRYSTEESWRPFYDTEIGRQNANLPGYITGNFDRNMAREFYLHPETTEDCQEIPLHTHGWAVYQELLNQGWKLVSAQQ